MEFVDSLHGVKFIDTASGREMKYVYPDADHWTAGWILYRHPSGIGWVTLRKATDQDRAAISSAVVSAHHTPEKGPVQ